MMLPLSTAAGAWTARPRAGGQCRRRNLQSKAPRVIDAASCFAHHHGRSTGLTAQSWLSAAPNCHPDRRESSDLHRRRAVHPLTASVRAEIAGAAPPVSGELYFAQWIKIHSRKTELADQQGPPRPHASQFSRPGVTIPKHRLLSPEPRAMDPHNRSTQRGTGDPNLQIHSQPARPRAALPSLRKRPSSSCTSTSPRGFWRLLAGFLSEMTKWLDERRLVTLHFQAGLALFLIDPRHEQAWPRPSADKSLVLLAYDSADIESRLGAE